MHACHAGAGVRCWSALSSPAIRKNHGTSAKHSVLAGFGVSVILHGTLLAMAAARPGREGYGAVNAQPVVVTLRVTEPEPPTQPQGPFTQAGEQPSVSPPAARQSSRPKVRRATARPTPSATSALVSPEPTHEPGPALIPSDSTFAADEGVSAQGPGGPGTGVGMATGSARTGGGLGGPVGVTPSPRIPARVLHSPRPLYPRQARLMGWEGVVVLRLLVDTQGVVAQVTVTAGSGYVPLDEAAVEAARHWRFEPARQGDHPIAMPHEIRVRFRLSGTSG